MTTVHTGVPKPTGMIKTGAPKVDKINSLICVTIYHENPVRYDGRGKPVDDIKYYMRYENDKELENEPSEENRIAIEIQRSVKLVLRKLNGPYAGNRIKSIYVFYNTNKGMTDFSNGDNKFICSLVISSGGKNEPKVEESFDDSTKAYLMDLMASWYFHIQRSR